jgi:hypothetical protein
MDLDSFLVSLYVTRGGLVAGAPSLLRAQEEARPSGPALRPRGHHPGDLEGSRLRHWLRPALLGAHARGGLLSLYTSGCSFSQVSMVARPRRLSSHPACVPNFSEHRKAEVRFRSIRLPCTPVDKVNERAERVEPWFLVSGSGWAGRSYW